MKDNRKNRVAARGLLFLSIATFVVLGGCETPLSDALARISDNDVEAFWITDSFLEFRADGTITEMEDGSLIINLPDDINIPPTFLTHWDSGAFKVTNLDGIEQIAGVTIHKRDPDPFPLEYIFMAANGNERTVTVYPYGIPVGGGEELPW
jgi:hypothetical protein